MDDLQRAIAKRKRLDPEFANTFDKEYQEFKIGVVLKEEENKELGQVLTPDQMKKWQQGESVKNFLNQDETGDADRTSQTSGMSF